MAGPRMKNDCRIAASRQPSLYDVNMIDSDWCGLPRWLNFSCGESKIYDTKPGPDV